MAGKKTKKAKAGLTEEEKAKKLQQRALYLRVSSMALGVFVLFLFISVTSYLFDWTFDAAPVDEIANKANRAGNAISRFLVCDCLGLASYVLIFYLAALCRKMFQKNLPAKEIYTAVLSLALSILAAVSLSCISSLFGSDAAFGGGLGGRMGSALNMWLYDGIGRIVELLVLALFWVLWLLMASPKFKDWFTTAFEPKDDNTVKGGNDTDSEFADGSEIDADTDSYADTIDSAETEDTDDADTDDDLDYDDEADSQEEESVDRQSDENDESDAGPVVTVVEDNETIGAEVSQLEKFDIREGMENYKAPSIDLLNDYSQYIHKVPQNEIEYNTRRIQNTLLNYKIKVNRVEAIVGPTVTLYKVFLADGVKSASVRSVENDIGMALNVSGVRVVPLRDSVGIEVPNEKSSMVPLKSMLNDDAFRESKAELPAALGYTITQEVKVFDLADAPHLLIAGATKQGKSVGLNVIITSLLYAKHPSEMKFVFIDPKMVEFSNYAKLLNHYLAVTPGYSNEQELKDKAIIKNAKDAELVLRALCTEMDMRFELFSKAGVNQLARYNEKFSKRHLRTDEGHHFFPYLVVVIDEYADLIMSGGISPQAKAESRSIMGSVVRLAQKGRAAGIHVIIATQRPSVDVVTGLIKSNFPMRIAFKVSSRTDSGTILGTPGAEKLIGKGDLLMYANAKMERVQCAMVDMNEIDDITSFIGKQNGYREHCSPYILPEPPSEDGESDGDQLIDMNKLDQNFEDAARLVVTTQRGSTSDLQRRLAMGYARSGKVMDQLQAAGIVGPQVGSKPREVLIKDLAELEPVLDAFLKRS